MSESISNARPTPSGNQATSDSLRLVLVLSWKELREFGFYSLAIMGVGVALTFLVSNFWSEPFFGTSTEVAQSSLVRVFPVLIILTCMAASFAIEHENQSFNLLRSLPLSTRLVFGIKIGSTLLLAALSVALFWPLGFFVISGNENILRREYLNSLPGTGISMGEAALWALFFSLRGKRVMPALIKATVGFMAVTVGFGILSQLDVRNTDADAFFFWLTVVGRSAVALVLATLIRQEALSWMREPVSAFAGKRAADVAGRKPVHPILFDRKQPWATTRRLIWFQWRANRSSLVLLGLINLGWMIAVVTAPYGSALSYGMGHFAWVVTVAGFGVVSTIHIRESSPFLMAVGCRPRRIWLIHGVTLLLFCLVGAALFSRLAPPISQEDEYGFWFYLQSALIAFGLGQLATTLCRSLISAYILAGLMSICGYALFLVSFSAFRSQLSILVLLSFLPLAITGYFSREVATRNRVGHRFWLGVPVAFALALIPLPLQRIYEVDDANVEPLLSGGSGTATARDPELDPELDRVRQIGDELIRIEEAAKRSIRTETDDGTMRESMIALAQQVFETEVDMLDLLQSNTSDVRDLRRLRAIQTAHTLARLSATLKLENQQTIDPAFASQLFAAESRWNHYGLSNELLYWCTSEAGLTNEDIRSLIRRYENESRIFDVCRAYAIANYRIAMATSEFDPIVFPDLVYDVGWFMTTKKYLPWEIVRFRRQLRNRLRDELAAIDELESYHREHEFGYEQLTSRFFLLNFRVSDSLLTKRFDVRPFATFQGIIFNYRAHQLYLALVLWQREHDGQFPDNLKQLEGEYLRKVPVSPVDGQPFRLAPHGLPQRQVSLSRHTEFLRTKWASLIRYFGDGAVPGTVADRPFIWVNYPVKHKRFRTGSIQKINSVDEFIHVQGASELNFWILPRYKK